MIKHTRIKMYKIFETIDDEELSSTKEVICYVMIETGFYQTLSWGNFQCDLILLKY